MMRCSSSPVCVIDHHATHPLDLTPVAPHRMDALVLPPSAAAVMDVGEEHVCATIGSTPKCWGESHRKLLPGKEAKSADQLLTVGPCLDSLSSFPSSQQQIHNKSFVREPVPCRTTLLIECFEDGNLADISRQLA